MSGLLTPMLLSTGLFLWTSSVRSTILRRKWNMKKESLRFEKAPFVHSFLALQVGLVHCDNHHKRLASCIAIKRKNRYGDVIRCMRNKLRFALLKCVLMAMGLREFEEKTLSTMKTSWQMWVLAWWRHGGYEWLHSSITLDISTLTWMYTLSLSI